MTTTQKIISLLAILGSIGLLSVSANEDIRNGIIDTFQPKGSLRVVTQSADEPVTIFLDGIKKGQTPLEIKRLDVGKHTVKVVKEGYKEYFQEIEIEARKVTNVTVKVGDEALYTEKGQGVVAQLEPLATPTKVATLSVQKTLVPPIAIQKFDNQQYPLSFSVSPQYSLITDKDMMFGSDVDEDKIEVFSIEVHGVYDMEEEAFAPGFGNPKKVMTSKCPNELCQYIDPHFVRIVVLENPKKLSIEDYTNTYLSSDNNSLDKYNKNLTATFSTLTYTTGIHIFSHIYLTKNDTYVYKISEYRADELAQEILASLKI